LSPDQIQFVELIGDATRTPIVQAVIKQIFEKQDLQRTLNSLDTIAKGASLNAAMMTPNFSV
jgi:molecular chaperone DnaK (HSP70)